MIVTQGDIGNVLSASNSSRSQALFSFSICLFEAPHLCSHRNFYRKRKERKKKRSVGSRFFPLINLGSSKQWGERKLDEASTCCQFSKQQRFLWPTAAKIGNR